MGCVVRIRQPSPAMGVALISLFVALPHEHRGRRCVPSEQRRRQRAEERLRGHEGAQGSLRDVRQDRRRRHHERAREERLADDVRLQPAPAAVRPDRRRRPGRPDRSSGAAGPPALRAFRARRVRRASAGGLLGSIRMPTENIVVQDAPGRERRAPTSARCAPAASVRSAPARAGLPPARPTCSTPSSCGRSSTGAE